jgi:hypothetical protein
VPALQSAPTRYCQTKGYGEVGNFSTTNVIYSPLGTWIKVFVCPAACCVVSSKVYLIFFNRCFCGEGFRAKQMNGLDFSSTHSVIPFFALLIHNALGLVAISALDFTMAVMNCDARGSELREIWG